MSNNLDPDQAPHAGSRLFAKIISSVISRQRVKAILIVLVLTLIVGTKGPFTKKKSFYLFLVDDLTPLLQFIPIIQLIGPLSQPPI